jgi:hypothetical protein
MPTLESKYGEFQKTIEKRDKGEHDKRQRLHRLKNDLRNKKNRDKGRYDTIIKIRVLENELSTMERRNDEIDYLMDLGPVVQQYTDEKTKMRENMSLEQFSPKSEAASARQHQASPQTSPRSSNKRQRSCDDEEEEEEEGNAKRQKLEDISVIAGGFAPDWGTVPLVPSEIQLSGFLGEWCEGDSKGTEDTVPLSREELRRLHLKRRHVEHDISMDPAAKKETSMSVLPPPNKRARKAFSTGGGRFHSLYSESSAKSGLGTVYERYIIRVEGNNKLTSSATSSTTSGNKRKRSVSFEHDICNRCMLPKRVIDSEGAIVCPQCGITMPYLDTGISSFPYGTDVESAPFAYKRSNHFNEWLAQFQAKERTEIPDEHIGMVKDTFRRTRRATDSTLTRRAVRTVLKKLKMTGYYEHVPQIIHRLTGISPPELSPKQEERLRLMFKRVQQPFKNVCPPDRRNFLSYSYVLFKFCELLGYDELLKCFPLLKSREKLHHQDVIWRGICSELGWEFIPSI